MHRVLQVVTIMNYGGIETMIMNYYRAMNREKIQFDFLVHREERGQYDDEIESLGGKIFRAFPIKPWNYGRYFRFLKHFFDEHKEYHVIHSHINENSGFILNEAKNRGIKGRIAHSHIANLGIDFKIPFRYYGRYYLKRSTNMRFACGDDAGRWLYKSKDFSVMHNAIDAELFRYNRLTREKERTQTNVQKQYVIGHVGRFGYQKNHEFLIDIFYSLINTNDNAILWLIGTGELDSDIKKKVKELDLNEKVVFWEDRSDVADLMQAMDIFVFPSLFEGLPVAGIEAQAAGLPCIMSDTISQEVDKTGIVEFISLKKDANYWAKRILAHKDDKRIDTYQQIVDAGYDVKSNAKWLQDLYLSYYE